MSTTVTGASGATAATGPTAAAPVPVKPPVVVPRVKAYAGRQRVGHFIAVRVEGELVWLVWRAMEPTEEELLAVETAARAGIAARGAWDIADVTKEAVAYFGGAAPMVLTETLTVDTPKAGVAGTATTYSGEYTGAAPEALDFWFDAGVRGPAPTPVVGSGKWSFSAPAPAVGTHTLSVKVPGHEGALGVSGTFVTTAPVVGASGATGASGPVTATGATAAIGASGATGAAALAVKTPGTQVVGVAFTLSGTYSGLAPTGIELAVDGGAFSPIQGATIASGVWSASAVVDVIGTHAITARDTGNTAESVTTGGFAVAPAPVG